MALQYQFPDLAALRVGGPPRYARVGPYLEGLRELWHSLTEAQDESIFSKEDKAILKLYDMPLSVAYSLPDINDIQADVSLKYYLISSLLDDTISGPDTARGLLMGETTIAYLEKLLLGETPDTSHITDPLIRTIFEMIDDSTRKTEPFHREAYLNGVKDLTFGMYEEQKLTNITVENHFVNRRLIIAISPVAAIIRWSLGLDWTNDVLETPSIKGLLESTQDICGYINDIYSYKKECRANDVASNMIHIALQEPSLGLAPDDVQGAVDFVVSKIAAAYVFMDVCIKDAHGAFPHIAPGIDAYVDSLLDMISGFDAWQGDERTGRYRPFNNEEDRVRRIVRLD